MNDSPIPSIEKIKMKEHDNELRLKEERELTSIIQSLNRTIRETTLKIEILTKEYQSLITKTDKLEQQVMLERIRQSALVAQINACKNELEELKKTSVNNLSSVWGNRSRLFETVQQTADKCDIWALLMKPICDVKPQVMHMQNVQHSVNDDAKLKAANERRKKAIEMRNLLLAEPDVGEEFIRTRNALQYSMEIMASDQIE